MSCLGACLEFAPRQRHTKGMEFKDYYAVLGVAPDADAAAIKQAYRRLARKYHPDVSQAADAEAQFKAVGEAYEVLKDPAKRQQYDQLRQGGWRQGDAFQPPPGWADGFGQGFSQGFQGVGGDFSGFSDFFEALFGGGRRAGPGRSAPAAGRHREAVLTLDLETAYQGGRQRISVDQGGQAQSLEVAIPAGVSDGSRIRLTGRGEPGHHGGPAGDLLLEIRIRPHRLFKLQDRDVVLDWPISPSEAALGARLSVPTLSGSVQVQVPAGSNSGRKLRLKGRGLPARGQHPAGDQLVQLRIVVPQALTAVQRQAYEQLAEQADFDPRAGIMG